MDERRDHHWHYWGAGFLAVGLAFIGIAALDAADPKGPYLWTTWEAILGYGLLAAAVVCGVCAGLQVPFVIHPRRRARDVPTSQDLAQRIDDTSARLRPLLTPVRAELVGIRTELGRVMARDGYDGVLNIFWAGTQAARDRIAALDTDEGVYPAISAAYTEIIRFCGEVDEPRPSVGQIEETDGIERAAVSVYAAIARIDAWERTN